MRYTERVMASPIRSAAFALPGLLTLAACAPTAPPSRPDVLLICLDTVRADHLGCYGYGRPTTPHLDALAAESTVFADASAAACWTKPSVPSFLTGTWPIQHGVYEGSARGVAGETTDLLPADARTLAESFADAGYETAAFVHNAQLRRGNGFEQGFGVYEEGEFDARDIRWRARDWIESRPAGKPFFLYLHLLDAHFPCPVPSDYATKFSAGADLSIYGGDNWKTLRDDVNHGRRTLTAEQRESLVALYDGAICYADDQLGRLFEALQRGGTWKNLVVCVVADHGEEFLEHGRMGHGHGLYENLLRVPWILRRPGRAAARRTESVGLVDLPATLLAAAGLAAPATSMGVDRLTEARAAGPIFAEHKEPNGYEQSWREGRWKLVRRYVLPSAETAPESRFELPAVGSPWEVDIERVGAGTLRATKAAPGSDPPSEEFEIKGSVERREPSGLVLCGQSVEVDRDTELYGELPVRDGKTLGWNDGVPAEGVLVKAVARLENGRRVARKIKFYAASEPLELSVRGPIVSVRGQRGQGTLEIGGVSIEWDASTRWPKLEGAVSAEMSREDILRILDREAGSGAPEGTRVESSLFDLASDPGELKPVDDAAVAARLGSTLDAFSSGIAPHRVWGPGDRTILDPAAVEALRKLGYVR